MGNSSEKTGRIEKQTLIKDECSICLDIFHKPCKILPCKHYFCDPCLRRLFQSGTTTCPLCREQIEGCFYDNQLEAKIQIQHKKQYIKRKRKEERTDVYELPLPGYDVGEMVDPEKRKRKQYILLFIMFVSYFWSIYSISNVMKQWSIHYNIIKVEDQFLKQSEDD